MQEIGRQPLHNLGVRKLLVVMLMISGLAFAQTKPETLTARQYYEELKAASGVNKFATLVCFRSDDPKSSILLPSPKKLKQPQRQKAFH